MITMKTYLFKAIFGFVLSVFLLAGAASALTVTVSPDHVSPGDTVTVDIKGLQNNSACSLTFEAVLDIPQGSDQFVFDTGNITIPFEFQPTGFTITNMNTVRNQINITEYEGPEEEDAGEYEYVNISGTSVNGIFTKQIPFTNAEQGSFEARDAGTVVPGMTHVTVTSLITAIVTGPEDAVVTFTLGDSDSGTLHVLLTANDTIALSQEITITGNQKPVQTGPVFNSLGFLVTPGKASAFTATANPFSVQPGTGGAVMMPGGMLSFFSPTSWGPIQWNNRWAAAFSV